MTLNTSTCSRKFPIYTISTDFKTVLEKPERNRHGNVLIRKYIYMEMTQNMCKPEFDIEFSQFMAYTILTNNLIPDSVYGVS